MIKNILLVGAGGALGSVARYLLTYILTQLAICSEIATFAINVVGSFAIGMAISALGNMGYLFAAVGFCGGFTTFSTFFAKNILQLSVLIFSLKLLFKSSPCSSCDKSISFTGLS